MALLGNDLDELLDLPASIAAVWPWTLRARLCDLRPRFLPKGSAGRGYRAVARNGRVLLASDRPLPELVGRVVQLRLQTWHRRILPEEAARPWGILLAVRGCDDPGAQPDYAARLVRLAEEPFVLALHLGGGSVLEFRRPDPSRPRA